MENFNEYENPNFIQNLKNIFLKLYFYFKFDFYKIYKILETFNLLNPPYNLTKIYEILKDLENKINNKLEITKTDINISIDKLKSKVKFFWEEDFLNYLILNDYPIGLLFYNGDYNLLSKGYKKIAIVGSRKPETKTIKFINSFFEKYKYLLKDFVIVSGLAVGVDALVHKLSIENNIKTIAVLGNGIFYYYPAINKELQLKISKSGLLLSEYPDNIKPQKYYFPYRNRIISLISDIVIVFQAAEKSGSITTGKYAIEFGKELIVPFLDFNSNFNGSKKLINSGGKLVSTIEELANTIIDYFNLKNHYNLNNLNNLSEKNELNELNEKDNILENTIIDILKEYQELSITEISQKLKEKLINNKEIDLDITKIVFILSKLELDGKLESKYGSIYKIS